jgi:hypothetical protein
VRKWFWGGFESRPNERASKLPQSEFLLLRWASVSQ